jgi:RNA polymerase sigma factor (sigma-70 family)
VNGEIMSERRFGECGRGYPARTNPNRPSVTGRTTTEVSGRGGSYPERCNPSRRRNPLTEEQRELASQYLTLACSMVRQAGFSVMDRDEFKSVAYVALVEAARTFDPAQKVNFVTFARHRIRGALLDCRRSLMGLSRKDDAAAGPKFRRLSLHDQAKASVLEDIVASPEGSELEETEDLESYLRRLPKAQASACRLIYLDGKTQDEAAAHMGYSKAYLSRLHRDALESLGREYAERTGLGDKTRGEAWN